MNDLREPKKQVDHYLNAIKMTILRGTSLTSIQMSVKDENTLRRLGGDIVPVSTLLKLKKVQHAEANEKFLQMKEWIEKTEDWIKFSPTINDEDKYQLLVELSDLLEEVISGTITATPHAVLMSYLDTGVTYEGSYISKETRDFLVTNGGVDVDLLKEACVPGPIYLQSMSQLGEDAAKRLDGYKVPFPVNYLIYAEMTEIELIGNVDKAPATANTLRVKLAKNFLGRLEKGLMSPREEMSLYRILGPERLQPKAAVEVNNNNNVTTNQQLVIVKDSDKLKPTNLVVGDNNELLGVGKSYGNIGKSQLLRLAAGERPTSEILDRHREEIGLVQGTLSTEKETIAIRPS